MPSKAFYNFEFLNRWKYFNQFKVQFFFASCRLEASFLLTFSPDKSQMKIVEAISLHFLSPTTFLTIIPKNFHVHQP
jgi:hypothetical protein